MLLSTNITIPSLSLPGPCSVPKMTFIYDYVLQAPSLMRSGKHFFDKWFMYMCMTLHTYHLWMWKLIWGTNPGYTLSVSLIRCTNEVLKNLHLKRTIKGYQRNEKRQVTWFSILISPHRLLCYIKWWAWPFIQWWYCHRYLNSDCIYFKTFVFLAVYRYNTDIKVQQIF